MTSVIDFGPIDWGRIWGDRASLVSAEHLTDLNGISPATHTMSPGYWRNLFSSYPEVISRSGFISNYYVLPGKTPKYVATEQDKPMGSVQSMNTYVNNSIDTTRKEAAAMMAKKVHPIGQGFIIIGRETGATKLAEKVIDIVGNAGTTITNIVEGVKDLTDDFKDASKHSKELLQGAMAVGAVVLGAYVYSSVK